MHIVLSSKLKSMGLHNSLLPWLAHHSLRGNQVVVNWAVSDCILVTFGVSHGSFLHGYISIIDVYTLMIIRKLYYLYILSVCVIFADDALLYR